MSIILQDGSFFSALGGSLSLWLGISFCTLFELVVIPNASCLFFNIFSSDWTLVGSHGKYFQLGAKKIGRGNNPFWLIFGWEYYGQDDLYSVIKIWSTAENHQYLNKFSAIEQMYLVIWLNYKNCSSFLWPCSLSWSLQKPVCTSAAVKGAREGDGIMTTKKGQQNLNTEFFC